MKRITFDPSKVKLIRVNPHSVFIEIDGRQVYCFWRLWNRIASDPNLEVFIEETDRGDWLAVLSRF